MGLLKNVIGILTAVALLAAAASLQPRINDMRRDNKLTFEEPLEGVPPILVVTTTALGCFRGIIADVLWIRASNLKEEGKYFEHMQLSDWICKLEPRFPKVWAYRAWDMAYNISVQLPTWDERWKWVSKGIELLRDDGIRYNPSSAEIYKELAWIYFHKVGDVLDQAHWYYKEQLLLLMEDAMGPEPDLAAFAAAPKTYSELMRDESVIALVSTFKEAGIDLKGSFFELARNSDAIAKEQQELFAEHRDDAPMKRFETYARANRLRTELKLEPDKMIELTEEYGPLDWRFPATHSLYWIEQGLEHAPESSEINYDRIAYFSIQSTIRRGRIRIVERNGEKMYLNSPDYRFVDTMERIFLKLIAHYKKEGGSTIGIESAYRYFLEDVVRNAYFSGNSNKAARFYKKRYPEQPVSPRIVRDFVRKDVKDNITVASRYEAVALVEVLLERMLLSYASGDDENAAYFESQATLIHSVYNEGQQPGEQTERIALAPLKDMKRDVRERILREEYIMVPFPKLLHDNLKDRLQTAKETAKTSDRTR